MRKFIRLSKEVINPAKIVQISKFDNSYYLCLDREKSIRGMMLGWIGWVTSEEHNGISVYKETNPEDYAALEKWIDENT